MKTNMNGNYMKLISAILILIAGSVWSADTIPQNGGVDKIRVVVLGLVPSENARSVEAAAMTEAVRKALESAETRYHVVSQEEMQKRAKVAGGTIPSECITEFCAYEMGQMLAASKIITGEYEVGAGYRAVKLKSFDLEARDFTQKTAIAAECPAESLHLLAATAVAKLFGFPEPDNNLVVRPFRGKEINRTVEWGIAAVAAAGGAFAYAASTGQLSPKGNEKGLTTVAGTSSLSRQRGAFADLMMNARPHGMGGAFVGLSDDANALAYNPAGLVRLQTRTITAGYMHFRIDDGSFPYSYAAYCGPVTRTFAHGVAVIASPTSYGSSETQVIIGAAKLFDDPESNRRPFSIGLNVKLLMMSASKATEEVYAFQENSVEGAGFGASFDLGTQIQLSDRITAGVLLKDIASYISYKNVSTGNSYTEGVPPALIIGGHYRFLNTVNLVLDGHKSLFKDVEDHVRLGIEKRIMEVLALRVGMSQNFSMESNRRYHAGFGIDTPLGKGRQRLSADYSYEYFHTDGEAYGDLSGSQRFAVSAKF